MSGIYIKEGVGCKKIPARFLAKSSIVGFTSCRRTWGTGSRKNLMKMRLECRSTRSVSWAVKKASSQSEVERDERRTTIITSKSSFLPEEPEELVIYVYIGPRAQSEDEKSSKEE